ncbi:DUF4238 domain-containing protein [bacterium]|nr:MAG: DUF4238 domain-containing protein [bacterium]
MSTKKRHHHFISDFLSKKFSPNSSQVYVYDHTTKQIKFISSRDLFVRKHLYTIETKVGRDSNLVEDIYEERFETPAANTINSLLRKLEKGKYEMSSLVSLEGFTNILRFCIASDLRTPNRLMQLRLIVMRGLNTLAFAMQHANFDEPDETLRVKANPDYLLLKSIEKIDEIVSSCFEMRLHIILNRDTDKRFVLPDQPVVLITNEPFEYKSSDLQILFPISSRVLLIFDRKTNSNAIIETSGDEVDKLNLNICSRFYKYIGCESDSYLKYFTTKFDLITQKIPTEEDFEREVEAIRNDIKAGGKIEPGSRSRIVLSKDGVKYLNLGKKRDDA